MTNNPDRRQRPISTSPTGPSPVRPPPFSSPGPSHRNQQLDDPRRNPMTNHHLQESRPWQCSRGSNGRRIPDGDTDDNMLLTGPWTAETTQWIGDTSLAKFKSFQRRASKKTSKRQDIARTRGRALLRRRRHYKEKQRKKDEVMALQHQNWVLTRENKGLKMTMGGLQRHWGNQQHMYPPGPPSQDYYT